MSDYKEGCIYHKKVQQGIIDQRPISNSKKKLVNKNWLTIYWHDRNSKWHVWNEYTSEELARKQMTKMIRYWPMYVIERSIFDSYYSYCN